MKIIKISELKVGPIRDTILPSEFIERVKEYKAIIKEVEASSLKETLNNFRRDLHPENELLEWEKIASKYELAINSASKLTLEQKNKVFEDILSSSLGM